MSGKTLMIVPDRHWLIGPCDCERCMDLEAAKARDALAAARELDALRDLRAAVLRGAPTAEVQRLAKAAVIS